MYLLTKFDCIAIELECLWYCIMFQGKDPIKHGGDTRHIYSRVAGM